MEKILVVNGWIILAPIKKEEQKSESGIIIPEEAGEARRTMKTEVLSVGTDVLGVKTGDIVLFKEYGPESIWIDSEEVLLAKPEHIIAIFKEVNKPPVDLNQEPTDN